MSFSKLKPVKNQIKAHIILKDNKGQALLIIVVLIMFTGALFLMPSLFLTTSTIKHIDVTYQRTREFYAADAGVKYAVQQIQNTQIPSPTTFQLETNLLGSDGNPITINGYYVWVVINAGIDNGDGTITFPVVSQANKSTGAGYEVGSGESNIFWTQVETKVTRAGTDPGPYTITNIDAYQTTLQNPP